MPKEGRKYVQLNLDLSKAYEKEYADFLDLLDQQGINNKKALMMAIDSLRESNKIDKLRDITREIMQEENNTVIEEIRDLKLMIKAMASGAELVFTKNSSEDNNIIKVDDSEIDPSELNSF